MWLPDQHWVCNEHAENILINYCSAHVPLNPSNTRSHAVSLLTTLKIRKTGCEIGIKMAHKSARGACTWTQAAEYLDKMCHEKARLPDRQGAYL